MPIRHKFVSTKPDPTNTSLLRPSNWNEDHVGMNVHTHTDAEQGGVLPSGGLPANVAQFNALAAAHGVLHDTALGIMSWMPENFYSVACFGAVGNGSVNDAAAINAAVAAVPST